MSEQKMQKAEDKNLRVQVGNLPQQDKELREREAENIRGGGGLSGGVLGSKHIGEEIPQ